MFPIGIIHLDFSFAKKLNDIYFGEKNSAGAVEPAVEI